MRQVFASPVNSGTLAAFPRNMIQISIQGIQGRLGGSVRLWAFFFTSESTFSSIGLALFQPFFSRTFNAVSISG